jgi:hypothetical protein
MGTGTTAVCFCLGIMSGDTALANDPKKAAARAIRLLVAYDPLLSEVDVARHCRTIGRRSGFFFDRAKWLGPLICIEFKSREHRLNLIRAGSGRVGGRLYHLGVVRGSELNRIREMAAGAVVHISIAPIITEP